MSNSERDASLERTDHERALSITRASRDSELRQVDLGSRSDLENVDDSANTPHPSSHSGSSSARAVEVVEGAFSATRSIGLLSDSVFIIVESGNLHHGR